MKEHFVHNYLSMKPMASSPTTDIYLSTVKLTVTSKAFSGCLPKTAAALFEDEKSILSAKINKRDDSTPLCKLPRIKMFQKCLTAIC